MPGNTNPSAPGAANCARCSSRSAISVFGSQFTGLALPLVAVLLLGGFVFVLGGVRFGGGYTIYVDFDNPGSVKPGASVQVVEATPAGVVQDG